MDDITANQKKLISPMGMRMPRELHLFLSFLETSPKYPHKII
jgi:hypothetical protein